MRSQAHSRMICGRTNITRNPIKWNAACTTSHGQPMGQNQISMASNLTLAAVPQTITRGGLNLPRVCLCFPELRAIRLKMAWFATAYAPCEVHTTIRGTPVHVIEETGYPFQGSVRLIVNPATPLNFPLQLRIPAWATGTTITVNGQAISAPEPGSFAHIERTWKSADRVEIDFHMQPRVIGGFNNSVSIARGPLVFSYGIGESWVKLRDRGLTADWQVFPTSSWNYALNVDPASPSESIARNSRRGRKGAIHRTPLSCRTEGKSAKAHELARRGWSCRHRTPKPGPHRSTGRDHHTHTLRCRQTSYYGIPSMQNLASTHSCPLGCGLPEIFCTEIQRVT